MVRGRVDVREDEDLKDQNRFYKNVILRLYDMVNGDGMECPKDARCPICSFIKNGLRKRKREMDP